MTDDINIAVPTAEAAARLQENFDEVVARVNGDLMSHTIQPGDPISVEAAIALAERCIDHHLAAFADDAPLQSLSGEIKRRFRRSIEAQGVRISPTIEALIDPPAPSPSSTMWHSALTLSKGSTARSFAEEQQVSALR